MVLKLVDMRKTKISGKSRFYYPLFSEMHVCVYSWAFRLFEGRKYIDTNFKKEVWWIVRAKNYCCESGSQICFRGRNGVTYTGVGLTRENRDEYIYIYINFIISCENLKKV